MNLQTILQLLFLLPIVYSANVLVIGGVRGSHLFVPVEVAKKMVGFGHNVTVVTPFKEQRVTLQEGTFQLITIEDYDGDDRQGEKLMETWLSWFAPVLHHPSVDMFANMHDNTELMREFVNHWNSYLLAYFNGTEFAQLLEKSKFDLIVLEDSMSLIPMVPLVDLDIPIIGLYCGINMKVSRDRLGLPSLMNSEPSNFNDLMDDDSAQTFFERWQTLKRIMRYLHNVLPFIDGVVGKEAARTNRPVTDFFMSVYDVAFVLDHPVFSFPFLSPPNVFYLGPFHLKDRSLNPLPETFQEFLVGCPHEHTVFLSFGSYLHNISLFSGTPTILKTLNKMEVCVILKSEVDVVSKYHLSTEKFLQRAWLPQKDLLGSGKVDIFISHCGNNGRMESIYYNVPLLCIPLFADQYYNARMVKRNRFGNLITWENLDETKFRDSVVEMIREKAVYAANMKQAVEIARDDPGAGTDTLKFYSDLLIRNRKADFLVNRIISKQSSNDIYNIDMSLMVLSAFVCIIVAICACFYKLCKCLCKKMFKSKTD